MNKLQAYEKFFSQASHPDDGSYFQFVGWNSNQLQMTDG